jgi:hypothetical protein
VIKHSCAHEVNWYKEGFLGAYEQSAYFVWRLKGYKPIKKHIKKVQDQLVSVGFPDSVRARVAGCK